MGFLSKFLGAATAEPIEAVGNVVDDLFTSDDERLSHEEIKMRLAAKPHLAQIELNKVEARHRSLFVAGPRPFIIWVCGFALAYHFMLREMMHWSLTVLVAFGEFTPEQVDALLDMPVIDTAPLTSLVFSLLGLGGLRTLEKFGGRTK